MKFRKIFLLIVTAGLISGAVLYSCTRKKVDYLGPEYLSAPADFMANNFDVTPSINFVTGVCNITADFNARVTYYVTITGLTSGAEKKYTGVGSNITTDSEGGTWNGSHDGLFFFRAGETVRVKLTFLRSEYSLEKTATVTTARNFFANTLYRPVSTPTNNSYEGTNVNPGGFPVQFAFSEAVNDGDRFAERMVATTYGIRAIHGQYVLRIAGKSAQSDGFFVGGIQHRASGMPATTFMLPATWTDPSQIYFNVYVYGHGPDSKATVNLEFHESDASNPRNTIVGGKKDCNTPNTVGAFGHDPCSDDGWVYAIPIDFVGWRMISVKYSDFSRSPSLPNGGSGNGVKEPGRLARIQMGVVSRPAFAVANAIFDYPVISYGAPFDPSK